MTLARDPLVVIAEMRKKLEQIVAETDDQLAVDIADEALALSAPLPAPERPSVEECVALCPNCRDDSAKYPDGECQHGFVWEEPAATREQVGAGYISPVLNRTATGFQILSEVLEGPHSVHRADGDGRLDQLLNVLPRHRVLLTIHGSDDVAKRVAEACCDAISFVPWKDGK